MLFPANKRLWKTKSNRLRIFFHKTVYKFLYLIILHLNVSWYRKIPIFSQRFEVICLNLLEPACSLCSIVLPFI